MLKTITKHNEMAINMIWYLGQIFLLVDLRVKKFRSRVGGTKKINKKALKMTSWSFSELFFLRAFFFFFSELFFSFNISSKTVKLVR